MASKISWCDETINPVVGCSKISAGCQNCYAESMARRLAAMGWDKYEKVVDGYCTDGEPFKGWNGATAFAPSELDKPYKWKKPRSVFVSSMGDLFHESVWRSWIDDVMRMVANNSEHTFIFLTKRPERMKQYFDLCDRELVEQLTAYYQLSHGTDPYNLAENWPLPNLMLGVSVEDQATADERIPLLLKTPAAKRFISIEPMIGPVDLMNLAGPGNCRYQCLSPIINDNDSARPALDGVILGGESGPKARCLDPDWLRSVRDQCAQAEVPFMFKQWSRWVGPGAGTVFGFFDHESGKPMIDGHTHTELAWKVGKLTCGV